MDGAPGNVNAFQQQRHTLRTLRKTVTGRDKDLNFGIRYRYDWKAYRQQDLSGDMSRDNVHRWDGYVTYHINSDFTFAWQTTLYSKQNDYRYANHKKWATENAFVLQYHMTPDITPYIEYDYLDRQGVYNGRDNLSENSYRIGVSFKLQQTGDSHNE